MKKHRNKIIAAVIVASALTFAFFCGKDAPNVPEDKETAPQKPSDALAELFCAAEEPERTQQEEI